MTGRGAQLGEFVVVGVGLAFGVLGPGPQSVRSSSRPRVAAWKAQQDAARSGG